MRLGWLVWVVFVVAPPATARTLVESAPRRRQLQLATPTRRAIAQRLVPPAWAAASEALPSEQRVVRVQRALRRLLCVLSRRVPQPAWLLLLVLLASGGLAREEKRRDLQALRARIDAGTYHISIVTTAALPWMTGTAVNPLLRAAYLAKSGRNVTLCVPWLHPLDQQLVFPTKHGVFATPSAQEAHMRQWLLERGGVRSEGLAGSLDVRFYPARYDRDRGSALPLGDTTRHLQLPREAHDVAVLEEPEHLNWYHSGHSWRRRFKLALGVVHTNYIGYAQMYEPGLVGAVRNVNCAVVRAYCDGVVKLSDTLQALPRATVCNVHGVRAEFLDVGAAVARAAHGRHRFRRGAYFIGKVLWAKGHRLLIDYLAEQATLGSPPTPVDVYGGGEDLEAVKAAAEAAQLELHFHKATDHADPLLREYKVFVNPSQTEVLSTTTAEALAMGKFVVIQRHPSNFFFMDFANTLAYDTPQEFLKALAYALEATPAPLTESERRRLSWEGATERFMATLHAVIAAGALPTLADRLAWWGHQSLSSAPGRLGDVLRKFSGGGPVARQRWAAKRRYRTANATELVQRSVEVEPPPFADEEWVRNSGLAR